MECPYEKELVLKNLMICIIIIMMSVTLISNELIVIDNDYFTVFTGETVEVEITINIPTGYYAAHQEDFFGVDIVDDDGISAGRTIYPEESIETEYGYVKYAGTITLLKEVHVAANAKHGIREIELIVFYQLCLEDGTCLIPEEEPFPIYLEIIQSIGQPQTSSSENAVPRKSSNQVLFYLCFAFIGGIILNLMPCVLPILSIRAFNIIEQSENSNRNILINSLLYVAGILVSFLILATVITIIKLSGEMVGWGFQFQNPSFVVFLVSLMFVFSLSLFDIFSIQVPGLSSATKASKKSGYWGSFLMGIFCVLLATPCTAPFLGAALGFAFTQTPLIIFSIFSLVGLGLGFPFIIIGIFPDAVRVLPKPGEWMNVFKEILGFLLLAFAIKMIQVLLVQMGGLYVINVLYYMLILGFAVWLYGRFVTPLYPKTTQWIIAMLALLFIIFGAMFTLKAQPSSEIDPIGRYDDFWHKFSEDAVLEGLAQGRPVFVDFTAEYCMVCKTNEATVLNTSDIRQAFADHDVLMLKGDYTRKDPVIHQWLERYNRAGVPLYLLFVPEHETPIQLPEVLTKTIVLNALRSM